MLYINKNRDDPGGRDRGRKEMTKRSVFWPKYKTQNQETQCQLNRNPKQVQETLGATCKQETGESTLRTWTL